MTTYERLNSMKVSKLGKLLFILYQPIITLDSSSISGLQNHTLSYDY